MAKKTTEDIRKDNDNVKQFETEQKAKKGGLFNRFKNFLAGSAAKQQLPDYEMPPKEKKTDKDKRNTDSLLHDIGEQLSGLDEQNRVLMYHVATMRENNEVLLEQVSVLKKNNDILREQFESTLKKNRLSRMLNVVYTILAIGFVVARIMIMIFDSVKLP